MDIFGKMYELGLPRQSYVVVGGGTLVALGLMEWDDDIDIAVSQTVFDRLANGREWRRMDWHSKTVLKHDVYDVGVNFGEWTLEDILRDALWINGIPFISLAKLRAWKFAMGRGKDMQHVALIDDYLGR